MNENSKKIADLANGELSSKQIAEALGLNPRYVRKVLQKYNLPKLKRGAQTGRRNHQYVAGRRVDRDGYVLVSAPENHPYARQRPNRKGKLILEHRLVMEKALGRYLEPQEVVDHIDGLTLHNHPNNLRVFANNGEHLAMTICGKSHRWSSQGLANIGTRTDLGQEYQRVDIYRQRRERGEIRLRQILLAALQLGIDSPYLLGTHRHLEKKQIDYSSRTSLELALADLSLLWEQSRAQ